jgi:hypothetical protein
MISKTKIIVFAVGMIFGIPTSILAVQLKEGMFAKQLLNCQEDASNTMLSLLNGDPNSIRGSDFENLSSSLKACAKNADPRIGTVEFLREEHARYNKDITILK